MGLLGLNDLKLKLERYCAYQERSLFEVEKKLSILTDDDKKIALIISGLFSENFLNQDRFVDSFIQGKMNQKRWGKQKIRAGLIKHKVPGVLIDKKLSALSVDNYNKNLLALAHKKAKTLPLDGKEFENTTKIMRYLYSKGYTSKDWEGLDFKSLFSS